MQKLLIIITTLVIGFGIAYLDIVSPPAGKRVSNIEQPDAAPDFTFTDLSGVKHTLYDFKGKMVLVNVWATWCPPCVHEIPQMLELARRNPDTLIFIGLSVDDAPEDIEKFLNRLPEHVREDIALNNVIFPHDQEKAISKGMLGITAYPETLVVDKNGNIQTKIIGVADWLGPDIAAMIADQ